MGFAGDCVPTAQSKSEKSIRRSAPRRANKSGFSEILVFRRVGYESEALGHLGSSGVMTFVVNREGVVYQKDLGKTDLLGKGYERI